MRLFSRILVAAALVAAVAAPAAGQTLNTLEVQRLVAVDTPAAHVTLSKHYMALADAFAADAARFDALATAPSGNPNHATSGVNARRARQADAALQLSTAARDMAAYHQLLSIGSTPTAPADRARFDGGFGARVPTAADVGAAVAAARTAADHHVLEEYFATLAAHSDRGAKEHAAMAARLRVSGQRRGSEFAAMHCDVLAKRARDAAKDARTDAALHRQLANIG